MRESFSFSRRSSCFSSLRSSFKWTSEKRSTCLPSGDGKSAVPVERLASMRFKPK